MSAKFPRGGAIDPLASSLLILQNLKQGWMHVLNTMYNPKFCFGVFQVSYKIHPNPADRVKPFVRLVCLVLLREALPKID